MQKILMASLLGTALIAPFASHAQQDNYLKLEIGKSTYNSLWDSPTSTGLKLGLGHALNDVWDLEIGYVRFGSVRHTAPENGGTANYKLATQSLYAAGIGNYALAKELTAFGKVGLAVNRTTASNVTTNVQGNIAESDSQIKTMLLLGAGFSYRFTKEIDGIVDYTYYGKVSDADFKLQQMNVGLRYRY